MVWLLLLSAHYALAFNCQDIQRAQLRLQVHASNLANVATTRTERGGPYLPQSLECQGDSCKVVQKERTKTKYLPLHQDADAEGYVKFPDVDPIRERNALAAAAQELRLLAKTSVCPQYKFQTEIQNEISIFFNNKDAPVKRERVGFSDRHEVQSWSRLYHDGREEVVTF
jgi:flagellar basal-body rod protein FlgC